MGMRAVAPSILGAALLVAALCFPASAHRRSADADISGISIPGLTHGQMAVVASYRAEILDLAARQAQTDDTFRRLLTFGNIQYAYCLWGLAPASIADEASPFNECSHAYLSAAQALLVHMRAAAANDPARLETVEALISRIDADMVRKGSSFILCQFSGEAFNTATVIRPAWSTLPSHAPSLLAFGGLALILGAGPFALRKTLPARTGRNAA
jgi:hypothetical protein